MATYFLCHEIDGHEQVNLAARVAFDLRSFDAVLHLFPYACLPGIIAHTVFVRVTEMLDIPSLSVSIDEQTGQTGL